jgi:hypothetical protein
MVEKVTVKEMAILESEVGIVVVVEIGLVLPDQIIKTNKLYLIGQNHQHIKRMISNKK